MRLLLVDISGLAYATWHATAHKAVNEMYSRVLETVRGHLLGSKFDRVAICCDSPGKTFRHDLDPNYKQDRPERDPALLAQLDDLIETLEGDGCHVLRKPGFEADDIAASIVAWARDTAEFVEVQMLSDDKDWLAMVHDAKGDQETAVTQYRPRANKLYTVADVVEKFGVAPTQITDWLALTGDKSDNIPGVKNVGEVKATQLLTAFGDLEGISDALINNATKFTPALATNLRDSMEAGLVAAKSRALVQLNTDALTHEECAVILTKKEPKTMTANDSFADGIESAPTAAPTQPSQRKPPVVEAEPVSAVAESAQPAAAMVVAKPTNKWSGALEPHDLKSASWLAKTVVDSRMFSAYGNPQSALLVMMAGREYGLGAMSSLRSFHIVEGKPTMSAQLMMALCMSSPNCQTFRVRRSQCTDQKAVVEVCRTGWSEPELYVWTIEDAQRAGLTGKNNWKKYARDMLINRAIAEAARFTFPELMANVYTPEEINPEYVEAA